MSSHSEQVGFEISFWIAPWNRDEFLQTTASLEFLNDGTPADSQNCFEKVGADSWFLWRECWDNRADLEKRLQSSTVKTLLGAIEVLGKLDRLQTMALADEVGTGARGVK